MASHARSSGSLRSLSSVLAGDGGRVIPPPNAPVVLMGDTSSAFGVPVLGVPGWLLSAWTGERGRESAVVGDLGRARASGDLLGDGTASLVGEREGSWRCETGEVVSCLAWTSSGSSSRGGCEEGASGGGATSWAVLAPG